MMAFSDYPVPKEWPTFLPHNLLLQYLNDYSAHYGLEEHIRFNHRVYRIKPQTTDGEHNGRWEVIYRKTNKQASRSTSPYPRSGSIDSAYDLDADKTGIRFSNFSDDSPEEKSPVPGPKRYKREVFDAVMVCTGHHWKERMPDFPGVELFKGTIIHSKKYKVPYPFKDQRVLVVGVGASGLDISSELAHHSKSVYLSSRSGNWITPKTTLFGLPTDHLSTRATNSVPKTVINFAMQSLIQLHHGDLDQLKPKHTFTESTPVIGSQVFEHIDSGKIIVKPNIEKFDSNKVYFIDGTNHEIDAVIFCTGYTVENPFVDQQILGQEEKSNRMKLYKHVFPVTCRNLAFVGFVQPNGSILPVAEMQCRWVTRVFKGVAELPSMKEMRDQNDLDWQEHLKRFVPRDRMAIAVDTIEYMDMLASIISVKPDLWRLWQRDWKLAAYVTFGPCVSAQYRLYGPGKWAGARDVVCFACADLDLRDIVDRQKKIGDMDEPPVEAPPIPIKQ